MDDAKLTNVLNALAARIVFLECQVLALHLILQKAGTITEQSFDALVAKVYADAKDVLDQRKSDAERLADLLRRFEGPIQ